MSAIDRCTVVITPEVSAAEGYWASVGQRLPPRPRRDGGARRSSCCIVLAAILAPYVAPADPFRGSMLRRLRAIGFPGLSARRRRARPRHADQADLRRPALALHRGDAGHAARSCVGSGIGVFAAYIGGWVNTVVMRVIDVFFAFPPVLSPPSACWSSVSSSLA